MYFDPDIGSPCRLWSLHHGVTALILYTIAAKWLRLNLHDLNLSCYPYIALSLFFGFQKGGYSSNLCYLFKFLRPCFTILVLKRSFKIFILPRKNFIGLSLGSFRHHGRHIININHDSSANVNSSPISSRESSILNSVMGTGCP